MDPDSEVSKAASKILTGPLLFLLFISACQNKKEVSPSVSTEKNFDSIASIDQKKDSPLTSGKIIYLTFDDGPNKGTGSVMHIATEEKIPISMFLIGIQLHGSPGQWSNFQQLQHNPYIEIQNHSYTHAHNRFDKFYKYPQLVMADFAKAADSLGLKSNIVRTPGRNIWRTARISSTDIKKTVPASDSLFKGGYTIVGWDMEWPFNNHLKLTKTTKEMLDKVDSFFSKKETKTEGHLVLLAHDQSFADSTDAASLHDFIKQLKQSGRYQFATISKYPHLKQ